MIFGDKASLAIEADLRGMRTEHYIGDICIWASNQAIGDYGEGDILSVCAQSLFDKLKYCGFRRDSNLEKMPPLQILDYLHIQLFEDAQEAAALAAWKRYGRFLLRNIGESFDPWIIALVETDQYDRLVWRKRTEKEAHDAHLPKGQYERVVKLFVEWLQTRTGFVPQPFDRLDPIVKEYWPELVSLKDKKQSKRNARRLTDLN